MHFWRGSSISAVLTTWVSLAFAVPTALPVTEQERGFSLAYQAPAGCPEAARLVDAIVARTPGAASVAPEQAGVQLRVELRGDGRGTLWLTLPEGVSRREFPPAACVDAVESMALIASMVLEADVSERAAAAKSFLDPVEPEPAPASLGPETPTPVAVAGPPVVAARPAPTTASPATAAPRSRFRVGVGAGVLVESAVASAAAWGGSAGVVAWFEPGRSSVWAPSIRAEFLGTLTATEPADLGDVDLRLLAGRLYVCPLRLPVTPSFRVAPCLSGDYGSLRARGSGNTLNPATRWMPWQALGGALRAELALGRWLTLDSSIGLRGLTRHDRFVFHPEVTAYQVPAWSLGAGAGLSVALP